MYDWFMAYIIVKGPLNIIKRDGIAAYVCTMYFCTNNICYSYMLLLSGIGNKGKSAITLHMYTCISNTCLHPKIYLCHS